MLTQTQFFEFFDAAIIFFATIGTMVTVTSAVYALNAMRWVTDSNKSSWDVLALAVNIGIVEGFQLGLPVAVLQLILSRQWVSS